MPEAKSLLSAVPVLNQRHVPTLRDVNGDPFPGRARIDAASHRRCPPKVVEQPQDVVAGDGWLPFRMYYGPEFVARAIRRWLGKANIETAYIDPCKPWQNAAGESFNGKFRDECLSLGWLCNRIDAKIVIEGWRRHYNETRPHLRLGYVTPAEFKQSLSTNRPEGAISQV